MTPVGICPPQLLLRPLPFYLKVPGVVYVVYELTENVIRFMFFQVPAFESTKKEYLTESNAIAYFG